MGSASHLHNGMITSLAESFDLLLRERIKAYKSRYLCKIMALKERLYGWVIDEAAGQLCVLKHVCDVLVAKGIIDGDGGHAV